VENKPKLLNTVFFFSVKLFQFFGQSNWFSPNLDYKILGATQHSCFTLERNATS